MQYQFLNTIYNLHAVAAAVALIRIISHARPGVEKR